MSCTATCIVCQASSDNTTTTTTFYSLIPCKHIMCADCYNSPLTMISCYGCTACGQIPHDKKEITTTVDDEKEKKEEGGEEKRVENSTMASSTFTSSSTDYYYSSLGYYGNSNNSTHQQKACDFIPPPSKISYTNCTQEPLYPSIPTEIATSTPASYKDTTVYTKSTHYHYRCPHEGEEEEKETTTSFFCGASTEEETSSIDGDTTPTDFSSDSCSSDDGEEGGQDTLHREDKKKKISPPVVIIPKGCPDNQRPRRSPKPTHCEEHGKRLHKCKSCRRQYTFRTRSLAREAAQQDKFIRGQKEELRRAWMTYYE